MERMARLTRFIINPTTTMAALVEAVDGISLLDEVLNQVRVAPTVLAKAVDDEECGFGRLVRLPGLVEKLQVVETSESTGLMFHIEFCFLVGYRFAGVLRIIMDFRGWITRISTRRKRSETARR